MFSIRTGAEYEITVRSLRPVNANPGAFRPNGVEDQRGQALPTRSSCNVDRSAGLRTSAAHARWEEIGLGDVAPVIELTKELIGAHLA